MDFLTCHSAELPDVLFLDLNMPRKSGFECLSEIKLIDSLKGMPDVIFSTCFDPSLEKKLCGNGAYYYIRKSVDFKILKNVILETSKSICINKIRQLDLIDLIVKS